jgi:hypothetical protein
MSLLVTYIYIVRFYVLSDILLHMFRLFLVRLNKYLQINRMKILLYIHLCIQC